MEKELKVDSASGLHARSAQVIAETVGEFEADVEMINDNAEADAASVLELMMLAAAPGTSVLVRVDGPDSEKALGRLEELFENNFYKDDPDEG